MLSFLDFLDLFGIGGWTLETFFDWASLAGAGLTKIEVTSPSDTYSCSVSVWTPSHGNSTSEEEDFSWSDDELDEGSEMCFLNLPEAALSGSLALEIDFLEQKLH